MDFSRSPDDSTTVIVIDVSESPSASVNGKSDVAYPVNTVSSVPLCVDGVEVVGKSLTAFTVMATVLAALLTSPSLAVRVRTELVLTLEALVHVIEFSAALTSVTVPEKVIVESSVPSPAEKVRSPIPAPRVKVPELSELTVIVMSVSSTSAMTLAPIVMAVSSLPETSTAEVVHVGASLTAA